MRTLLELNEIPVSPEDTIEPLETVTSPNEPLVVADTVVPDVIPAVAASELILAKPDVTKLFPDKLILPVLEVTIPSPRVMLPNLD